LIWRVDVVIEIRKDRFGRVETRGVGRAEDAGNYASAARAKARVIADDRDELRSSGVFELEADRSTITGELLGNNCADFDTVWKRRWAVGDD
jgi:hypothetical protein